jgi:predicted nuclease of predicted toxin-antitoxin system
MRFLADENFPGGAVAALVAAGHDVVSIRTAAPGTKDKDVLAWAVQESRVLLTFDKDFGALAWKAKLPASCGVVLFRIPMPKAGNVGKVLLSRLQERVDWAGHFSVVERARIRMRVIGNR